MAEYIDKELLIEALKNREDCVDCTDTDCVDCMCDFIACIVPSDVAEVRHGKWEVVFDGNAKLYENMFECSVCKTTHIGHPNVGRYCPNCGAKMDGTPKERGVQG